MRLLGTISRYSPPNEWPAFVVKLVNDILNVPPTLASKWWTLHVKPLGGSHLAMASASRKARKTFSGLVGRKRCRRTEFRDMVAALPRAFSVPIESELGSIFWF